MTTGSENAKPAVAADRGAVVKITELGRSLERETGSIRNCIEQGTIPPALVRLAGNVRAWPVAEANAIIAAARGERILSKPRRPYRNCFSLLAWEARTPSRCGAMEKRKPSTISG
jgi:hypothetical protein